MKRLGLLFLLLCLSCSVHAWWNDEWTYRLPIIVDTSKTGGQLTAPIGQVPVLVRLHSANFEDFFSIQESLADLRFVADDDKTPLDFQVDHFDLLSQVLMVWVMVPEISQDKQTKIHMYYGNAKAVAADKKQGLFTGAAAVVVHFSEATGNPQDSTSNNISLVFTSGESSANGIIGRAAKFTAASNLSSSTPFNWMLSDGGSIGFWLKLPANTSGRVLTLAGSGQPLILEVKNNQVVASVSSSQIVATEAIAADQWQHVSLRVENGQMQLAINGKDAGKNPIEVNGIIISSLIAGRNDSVDGFSGELDELSIYNKAQSSALTHWQSINQGMNDVFIKVQKSEQLGAGGDAAVYKVIINSMDHISWVVVIIMAIMMVIGWIIMVAKWFYLRAVNKDNRAFLAQYAKLGNRDPAMLDFDTPEGADEYRDIHPITQAIFGPHDHFENSPIFHLFHRGMKEVKSRVGGSLSSGANPSLGSQAVSSIRAALDAQMTREIQKMQAKMTFLTMSVSGGPFIGLFGTVAGVMITFGAIAAAGDVNINAIAPGVSAALVATVGGLLVAIPAMFGYNFLSGIIKDSIADMRVFADEYVAKLAEYYQE